VVGAFGLGKLHACKVGLCWCGELASELGEVLLDLLVLELEVVSEVVHIDFEIVNDKCCCRKVS